MGAKFNNQDASLGSLLVGKYPTVTSTTPAPLDLPNRSLEWGVLTTAGMTAGYVLTVQSDGSLAYGVGGLVSSVTFTGDGTVLSSTPSAAVTAAGTVTAALATHTANVVLAGPGTGSAAAPTFRALVTADLPTVIAATTITIGSNHMTWGAAAPSTGTWAVGDVCWNTGAAAGGSPGWVNTSASGSGTWKAMAALAS
jgi:hypothetical protein